ncbi:MAG: hypothetical protein HYV09_27295 [Deltaproteobacteria bacterium]|nr:hypothetical protein [Deltaproteobacteria bacterium]
MNVRIGTIIAALALSACSSSNFSVNEPSADAAGDGAGDAQTEAAADAAPDVSDTGSGTTEAGSFTCRGPADCPFDKKYCCAKIQLGPGTPPSCPMTTASTSCQSSCPTNIPFSCPANGMMKLCKVRSDCADDSSNPNCCRITASGSNAVFCVSDIVRGYAIECY